MITDSPRERPGVAAFTARTGGVIAGYCGAAVRARADAGTARLSERDVAALVWCGQTYGVRADLLAWMLGVSGAVVRKLHERWRRAGLAETRRLGPGPGWCWLTRAGLEVCGLAYELKPPPLARLRHVRAAGVVRAVFEGWGTYRTGGALGAVSGSCGGGWAPGWANAVMYRTGDLLARRRNAVRRSGVVRRGGLG